MLLYIEYLIEIIKKDTAVNKKDLKKLITIKNNIIIPKETFILRIERRFIKLFVINVGFDKSLSIKNSISGTNIKTDDIKIIDCNIKSKKSIKDLNQKFLK